MTHNHNDKTLEGLHRLRNDFPFFAESCLKVRPKQGGSLIPFVLNPVQREVHKRLEDQLERIGRVRALVLKARQPGVSTYVAGRYYHKASMNTGLNVFIMAHTQDSSKTLFSIVDTFHSNNPLAPTTDISNAKSLKFDKLNSSYAVATAGQKATGRGLTCNLYHGSEVAFWANSSDHFSASVQTVPDLPGTEVILESTANGTLGEFYNRWQDAEAHKSEYEAIFIPWYALPEYSRPDLVTKEFELSNDPGDSGMSEVDYQKIYGLSLAQMAWRRNKILELRSDWLFKQEYPANSQEAFQSKGERGLIDPNLVVAAMKNTKIIPGGPVVFGVDPSGNGKDRFAIAIRQGHVCLKILYRDRIDAVSAVLWIHQLISEYNPCRVFIDSGGLGAPIVSQLKSVKPEYVHIVKGVNFGETSQFKKARPHISGPKNRKTEMWLRAEEWFREEAGVRIPQDDSLVSQLCSVRITSTVTNDSMLESKESLRSRGFGSPDKADALCLTFADLFINLRDQNYLNALHAQQVRPKVQNHIYQSSGGWML